MQHDAACAPDPAQHTPIQPVISSPWQMSVFLANGAQELNVFTLTAASLEPIAITPSLCIGEGIGKMHYLLAVPG